MADNQEIDIKIKATIDAANAAKTIGDLKKSSQELVDLYEKSPIGSKQFDQLGSALNKVDKQITSNQKGINALGQAMESLGSAIPGVSGAMEALNLILEANPIGLLVAAFGLLVAAFAKTEPVMDKIKEGFNIISSVVGVIIERLGYLANAVIKVFKGDFVGAMDDAKKATDGLVKSIEEAAEGADKATDAQIALEKQHTKNTKSLSLLNKQLQKQKTLMREQGKDQKKFAKDAIKTQEQITAIHVSEAQQELQVFKDLRKGRGELTRAEAQQEADLTAKIIDLQSEGEEAERRGIVEIARLEEEERKKKEKAIETAQDNERTRRKLDIDLEDDSLKKRLELFDLESEKEEESLRKAGASEEKITAYRNKRVAEITKEYQDEQDKIAAEKAKKEQDDKDRILKETEENAQKQLEIQTKFKKSQQDIDDAYNAIYLKNSHLTANEIYAIIQKNLQDTVDAEEKKKKAREKKEKESFEISKNLMSALSNLDDLFTELESQRKNLSLKQKNQIAKKEFNIKKGLGIVNAGINMAEGIAASATEFPFIPMGLVHLAAAITSGTTAIATIAAKKFTPENPSAGASSNSAPSLPTSIPGGSQFQASSFFNLGQTNPNTPAAQPQQVYVTEHDISSTQNKVSVIQGRGTLG